MDFNALTKQEGMDSCWDSDKIFKLTLLARCLISPLNSSNKAYKVQRVLRRESKTDSYSKDLLFLTCVAFCVITFEPIMIQTCSAPQNDRLIFSFVNDIEVVVKKNDWKLSENDRKNGGLFTALSFSQNSVFASRIPSSMHAD